MGVACTSVSCEHHVMSRLVSDAGNKHIAEALVKKVSIITFIPVSYTRGSLRDACRVAH